MLTPVCTQGGHRYPQLHRCASLRDAVRAQEGAAQAPEHASMAKRSRIDASAGPCWAAADPASAAPCSAGAYGTPDCPIDLTDPMEPPTALMGGGALGPDSCRIGMSMPGSAGSSGSLAPRTLLQSPGGGSGGCASAPGSADGGGGPGSLNPCRGGAPCGSGPGPQTVNPDPGAGAPGSGVAGGGVPGEGGPGGAAAGPAQEPAAALSDEQRMALDYAKRGCNLFITGERTSCGPVVSSAHGAGLCEARLQPVHHRRAQQLWPSCVICIRFCMATLTAWMWCWMLRAQGQAWITGASICSLEASVLAKCQCSSFARNSALDASIAAKPCLFGMQSFLRYTIYYGKPKSKRIILHPPLALPVMQQGLHWPLIRCGGGKLVVLQAPELQASQLRASLSGSRHHAFAALMRSARHRGSHSAQQW